MKVRMRVTAAWAQKMFCLSPEGGHWGLLETGKPLKISMKPKKIGSQGLHVATTVKKIEFRIQYKELAFLCHQISCNLCKMGNSKKIHTPPTDSKIFF